MAKLAKREPIEVDWDAEPRELTDGGPLEAGEGTSSSWLIPLLGLAGIGGLAYALLRERKPKSMPIVLPSTVSGFIQTMLDAITAVTPGFSLEARELMIAHAAYESGWGKAKAFNQANNPFNLTTVSGPFVPGGDTEYAPDGTVKSITQKWAAFPSIADGVAGYLKFIQASRYTDAYNRLINADPGFIESLYRGGYFTLPLEQYRQNFLSVLARVQRTLTT